MTHFSIEYNPYLVETIFKKNGKELSQTSKIGFKADQRLQVLLGKSVNWAGLLPEIEKDCGDNNIEISFSGRKIDYEDLKYAMDQYRGTTKFSLTFQEGSNDSDVIAELDRIFADIKKKNLPQFQEKDEKGRSIFEAYEEVKQNIFEINVIATMSSGKSTLINALLNTELLPSENKECTATVARILADDTMKEYKATCYAADDETIVYPERTVTAELMAEYNADPKVTYIDIDGPIPAIPNSKMRLRLCDTPGPNTSRTEEHGKLTNSIIRRTNAVVLYVMNATQFAINDDRELLQNISSEMKRAGKQSRDRFIFVINKCDELDVEKGETIDKLLTNVRTYLNQFDITDPTLIPISAKLALVIRKKRGGMQLSRVEKTNFYDAQRYFIEEKLLHFERYAVLTPSVQDKLQTDLEKYQQQENGYELEALIHSGVPAVEQTICEYIEKYAYPMKIKDAIKDIVGILDELNMKAQFEQRIANDENALKRVRQQIAEAKKKQEESKPVYEEYKKKIDEFQFSLTPKDIKKREELSLEELVKPYNDMTDVDKAEAAQLIESFQNKLKEFQEKCEATLMWEFDKGLFEKGQLMSEDYKKVVNQILAEINIEEFDFKKINGLIKDIKINDIQEIVAKNQYKRYKKVIRRKANPERAGFFGWFKFWKPREIEYTEEVYDGISVEIKQVIGSVLSTFSGMLDDNIDRMFKQAEKQLDDYKENFGKNIDTLDQTIHDILKNIDESTKEESKLKRNVEENRELSNWIAQKEKEIRTLLKF